MATISKDTNNNSSIQNSEQENHQINSAFTDDPYFKSLLNYNYNDFNNYHNQVENTSTLN